MTDVLAVPGGGYLAVGAAGAQTGPWTPAFWTSADGKAWDRVATDPALGAGRPVRVTIGGPGFVAVGVTGTDRDPTGSAIWTSPDGRRWTRLPADAGGGLDGIALRSVVAGPTGLLALGGRLDGTAGVVLGSTNGLDWSRAPTGELAFRGSDISVVDAAWARDRWVAVGHYLFGQQYGSAVAWTSPDGRTWTRSPDATSFGQGEMASLVAAGSGVVAVGTFGAPDNYIPTVWLSPAQP